MDTTGTRKTCGRYFAVATVILVTIIVMYAIYGKTFATSTTGKQKCKLLRHLPELEDVRVASNDARAMVEIKAHVMYTQISTRTTLYLPLKLHSIDAIFAENNTAQLTIMSDCATFDMGFYSIASRHNSTQIDALVANTLWLEMPLPQQIGSPSEQTLAARDLCDMFGYERNLVTRQNESYACEKRIYYHGYINDDLNVELALHRFRYQINREPSESIQQMQFGPTVASCKLV